MADDVPETESDAFDWIDLSKIILYYMFLKIPWKHIKPNTHGMSLVLFYQLILNISYINKTRRAQS